MLSSSFLFLCLSLGHCSKKRKRNNVKSHLISLFFQCEFVLLFFVGWKCFLLKQTTTCWRCVGDCFPSCHPSFQFCASRPGQGRLPQVPWTRNSVHRSSQRHWWSFCDPRWQPHCVFLQTQAPCAMQVSP